MSSNFASCCCIPGFQNRRASDDEDKNINRDECRQLKEEKKECNTNINLRIEQLEKEIASKDEQNKKITDMFEQRSCELQAELDTYKREKQDLFEQKFRKKQVELNKLSVKRGDDDHSRGEPFSGNQHEEGTDIDKNRTSDGDGVCANWNFMDHLQKNYIKVCNCLSRTDDVAGKLFEMDYIETGDLRGIHDENNIYKKNELLLGKIQSSTEQVFDSFLNILCETRQMHLSFLLKEGIDFDLAHVKIIQNNYTYSVKNIDPMSGLLDHMFQTESLTERECAEIKQNETSYKQNEELLMLLMRKDSETFSHFIEALHYSKQGHVAERLNLNSYVGMAKTGDTSIDIEVNNMSNEMCAYIMMQNDKLKADLKRMKVEYVAKIEQLREAIANKEETCQQYDEENKRLKEKRDSFEQQNYKFKAALEQREKELNACQQEKEKSDSSNNSTIEQLKKSNAEKDNLCLKSDAENEEIREIKDTLEQRNCGLQAELAQLSKKLDACQQEKEKSDSSNNSTIEQLKKYGSEYNCFKIAEVFLSVVHLVGQWVDQWVGRWMDLVT